VAADPSTDLRRFQRIAAAGALACIVSLPLPWYRLGLAPSFSKSGFYGFGFATAALLLTAASSLMLIVRVGRGRRLPRPLREGTLLAIAGAWSVVLIVFLMIDRPQVDVVDLPIDLNLGYGIFIALAGAVTMVVSGLRIRRDERLEDLTREGAAARTPSASSPPRSPKSPSRPR
jgi:hypothetical protein